MKVATICYPLRGEEVLLGMKKKDFGAGKWNGFGGKVKEGETIEAAAIREVEEESGLRIVPGGLKQVAKVSFYFVEDPKFECHVFFAGAWEGEPRESDEMVPKWFPLNGLPYKEMWSSDLYWLPAALQGHTLEGVCHFDKEGNVVERFEMQRVEFHQNGIL